MLRLKYYIPGSEQVVDMMAWKREEDWFYKWLNHMTASNPDVIFFLVEETTDVFNVDLCLEFGFDAIDLDRNAVAYSLDLDAPGTMHSHNLRTGHQVIEMLDEPGWRCLDCAARSVMWSLEVAKGALYSGDSTEPIMTIPEDASYGSHDNPLRDDTCDGTRRCTAIFHANDCPKWTE